MRRFLVADSFLYVSMSTIKNKTHQESLDRESYFKSKYILFFKDSRRQQDELQTSGLTRWPLRFVSSLQP